MRLLWLFVFLIPFTLIAQDNSPVPGRVFDDSSVPRIDLEMAAEDMEFLLSTDNPNDGTHFPATFIFDDGTEKDTLFDVGVRLRGNTSLVSAKKSFKISFNTFVPGREFENLEKMNLNGEHNDPTITRSKVCWDICREMEIPASRSNHIQLYVNGDFFGIYANVEHIDEEFIKRRFPNGGNLYKCLYPADLDYLGSNPDAYKVENFGRRTYELKTNLEEDDYSDLAQLIHVLNNVPEAQLRCELEKVFNVQGYLKAIALDVLTGNWDGPIYNKNNFYLYNNPETGRFEYIPFDLDNTLGVRWFGEWTDRDPYSWAQGGEHRPIYWRIMNNIHYRKQFSYYLNEFLNTVYTEAELFPKIDQWKSNIESFIEDDLFFPLDYGFTINDFNNNFENGIQINHLPHGIKEFITLRRNSALQQVETDNAAPILSLLSHQGLSGSQDVHIQVKIEDVSLASASVFYTVNGTVQTPIPLFDDGMHNDGEAGDNIYGANIPALGTAGEINYYVEAIDSEGLTDKSPYCESKQILLSEPDNNLSINEFMASNNTIIADEFGEYDDWVEIYNSGDSPINLLGKFLSDNISIPLKFPLPDYDIQPGGFLLIWCDNQPEQGPFHADFKLSAGGENVVLAEADGSIIDAYEFGSMEADQAIGRIPNGTGPYLPVIPTPGMSNQGFGVSINSVDNIELKIFPNPNQGAFFIEIKNQELSNFTITMYDAVGREIPYELSGNLIQLKNHQPGVFIIELKHPNGERRLKKVVVK